MGRYLAFLLLSFGLCAAAGPAKPWVVGLRGNEAATKDFAADYDLAVARTWANEYDNFDTGARIEENVQHQDVYIAVPKVMTATQLVEALLQAQNARTHFAARVIIAAPAPLNELRVVGSDGATIHLGLERLLRTAGAAYTVRMGAPMLKVEEIAPTPFKPLGEVGQSLVMDLGHPELAAALAKEMGIPYQPHEAGEPVTGRQIYFIAALLGDASTRNEYILKMLEKVEALRRAGNSVHLVSPYQFYARSDKIDVEGGSVGGALMARLIREEGATGVTMFRAHAPQSQGFYDIPSAQLMGHKTVLGYLLSKGVTVVVSPDAGFQKDATVYADLLTEGRVSVINKQREKKGGKKVVIKGITDPTIIKDAICVITDDEVGSGGTLAQAAKYLKELGAKQVFALVTHVTGNADGALKSPDIDEVIVTDTVPIRIRHPKLKVLSVKDELLAHLRSIEERRNAYIPLCPVKRLAPPGTDAVECVASPQ